MLSEAAIAEAALRLRRQLMQILQRQISQAVCSSLLPNLIYGVAAGNKTVFIWDVCSKIAGRNEGRSGDPHMDLLCPRFPQ